MEAQVHAYNKYLLSRNAVFQVPRLVDLAAELLGMESDEAFKSIDSMITRAYIWGWTRIPYTVLRAFLYPAAEEEDEGGEGGQRMDDNDKEEGEQPKGDKDTDPKIDEWQVAAFTLDKADIVFPGSVLTPLERTITRPKSLSGFEVLCGARTDQIAIQPSTCAFARCFEKLSDGLLKNLNWANIIIAGGMVLGTLVSVDAPDSGPNQQHMWDSSDIDMYVYGLSADEATNKIHHVYETFRSNLPAGTPTLAVRNSKTITFYARYPLRRLQIVLKLAESPKDVLLNFDLDICAMGWDGSMLWMLPRAARALETGCNVFTMSLVRGHYLSERRASHPKRVFKYAGKVFLPRGYGIRFLPSYVSSLSRSAEEMEARFSGEDLLSLDINCLAADACVWVEETFLRMRADSRIRYSDMDEGRSCLTGFTLFMRNATYWDMKRRRDEIINEKAWAYVSYEDTVSFRLVYSIPVFTIGTQYDDNPNNVISHPEYRWDPSFSLKAFKDHVEQSNYREIRGWDELDEVQRMTVASRMEILLDGAHDIKIPVLLPRDFAAHANTLVSRLQPETPILKPATSEGPTVDQKEGLFIWTITSKLMWQQQDRRIDELFEVLLAFCRVNVPIMGSEDLQAQCLFTNCRSVTLESMTSSMPSCDGICGARSPETTESMMQNTNSLNADGRSALSRRCVAGVRSTCGVHPVRGQSRRGTQTTATPASAWVDQLESNSNKNAPPDDGPAPLDAPQMQSDFIPGGRPGCTPKRFQPQVQLYRPRKQANHPEEPKPEHTLLSMRFVKHAQRFPWAFPLYGD
ncbi:hypothetical protein B0H19DRAFT_1062673 [Mycena capillaripes]|nr:hypothetical protein B0H19DRAFT_1062673 [Mycena capillaripes]